MSLAGVTSAGRQAAEARMTSRCTIRRNTGRTTQDESTGREVPVWTSEATAVPVRIKAESQRLANVDGGLRWDEGSAMASLPIGTDVLDSDYLEVTAGEWVGSTWRVTNATKGDQRTALRCPVVEVDRPEEWT